MSNNLQVRSREIHYTGNDNELLKPSKPTCSNQIQHIFPQTLSFDLLWLSSRREPDLLLESSSGNGNSNTTTKQHDKTNQSQLRFKKHILQSIQDTEQHSKTEAKFPQKNSHECCMPKTIGLSKTQFTRIQLLSQAFPPFCKLLQKMLRIHNNGKWTSSRRHANYSRNHCWDLPAGNPIQLATWKITPFRRRFYLIHPAHGLRSRSIVQGC